MSSHRRDSTSNENDLQWRDWSTSAFDEAREKRMLVLLDLSAVWCHWCHVMDETTYSDPDIIRLIDDNFIPVRVDIDRRPDISERYNRGGFPTTAFLSDMGESIWGATYVPPADMKRIMKAILDARTTGEIDQALERSRLQYFDLSKALEKKSVGDSEFMSTLFEDIFAAYDVEHGGFAVAPKFPHPDVVDLLLQRYLTKNDDDLVEAVTHTLDRMTEGLYDQVEGGVFRYSVTRDWREPHFEKMLETNAGSLRNLVHAYRILGITRFAARARGVAEYILGTLRDPVGGGFYGSQDADEEYYRLTAENRSKTKAPAVDKAVFAGWNAEAVVALLEAGVVLRERNYIDAALSAFRYSVRGLWNADVRLVRHLEGEDLYLFADQVAFLESLIAVLELSQDDETHRIAHLLVEGASKAYANPEGGFSDVMRKEGEIGELANPRRSLVENSRWARALALYSIASHDAQLVNRSWEVLRAFDSRDVEAHGLFAASYVSAWWVLERGPSCIEIHDSEATDPMESQLWLAAKDTLDPGIIVLKIPDQGLQTQRYRRPFAVVCTISGCSGEITDAKSLSARLSPPQSGQV